MTTLITPAARESTPPISISFRGPPIPRAERRAREIQLRAERKAGELLAAKEKAKGAPGPGHIPTGTTANHRIDVDEAEGKSDVMTIAPGAIGAGTEIGRATP
jgi:hypothetical protein